MIRYADISSCHTPILKLFEEIKSKFTSHQLQWLPLKLRYQSGIVFHI